MSWVTHYLRQHVSKQNDAAVLPPPAIVPLGDSLPLVHPAFPLAVCWRPKAACTTALKWFLFHAGLLEEALSYSPWPHDYREQVLYASPGYMELCGQALSGRDRFVVKVVRDPALRAVSGFLHLIRYASADDSAPLRDLAEWKQSAGLGDQIGLTFHQFMRYVIDRKREERPLDAHIAAQRCPVQDPRVDAFVPVENLANELRGLERRFDLPPAPLTGLSKSVHHNPPTSGNRWRRRASLAVVTPALLESLGTPSAEVFFDAETLQLIATAYAEDYDAYGSFYEPRHRVSLRIEPRVDRTRMPRFVAPCQRAA